MIVGADLHAMRALHNTWCLVYCRLSQSLQSTFVVPRSNSGSSSPTLKAIKGWEYDLSGGEGERVRRPSDAGTDGFDFMPEQISPRPHEAVRTPFFFCMHIIFRGRALSLCYML